MRRTDSFEKTLMLGKIEGGRRRGWNRMWCLDVITNWWAWVWASLGVGYRQRGLVCCSPWIRKSWIWLSDCTDWTLHEMIALSFSQGGGQGSSSLRVQIQVSCIAGGFFTNWVTREAQLSVRINIFSTFVNLLCLFFCHLKSFVIMFQRKIRKLYNKKIFTTKIIMMVWSFT